MQRPPMRRSASFTVPNAPPAPEDLSDADLHEDALAYLRAWSGVPAEESRAQEASPIFPTKLFRLRAPRTLAEPLLIERVLDATVPDGALLELSVEPSCALRIIANACELVGPNTNGSHRFVGVPEATLALAIEAVPYDDPAWDGLATITLITHIADWAPIVQRATIDVDPDRI
jgi:hypothetical protein